MIATALFLVNELVIFFQIENENDSHNAKAINKMQKRALFIIYSTAKVKLPFLKG